MSNADDNQKHPTTLPSPELNPLTNPVLGRHMGRWAEVYFTSPPEKREQAVQELLRELERDPAGGEGSAPATAAASQAGEPAEAARTYSSSTTFSATPAAAPATTPAANFPANSGTASGINSAAASGLAAPLREEFIQCRACGRLALVEQKFCGACGSTLPVRGTVPEARPRNGGRAEVPAPAERLREEEFGGKEKPGDEERFVEKLVEREDQISPAESFLRDGMLSWERGAKPVAEDAPRLFLDQQRARQLRSRRLMWAALAILVGTLFYVAARGTMAWLRAHEASQAAMRKDAVASVAMGNDASAKADSMASRSSLGGSSQAPQTAKPDAVAPATAGRALTPTPAGYTLGQGEKRNPTERADRFEQAAHAAHPGSESVSSPPNAIAPASAVDEKLNPFADHALADHVSSDHALGDHALADHALSDHGGRGAEELAIAESYLSGTQGKTRDSSEAAQWLWKSVAKQNAAAALLLSDLYVTGDGVARNCDQARLLLDAAARKGVPGAGERIRDLPNLGCE